MGKKSVEVFCYETKQKFNSKSEAARFIGLKSSQSIGRCFNNPNLTASDYHWCSDLSVFDNIELRNRNCKIVYCYETKQRFDSVIEASKFVKLINSSSINFVINKHDKTSAGYHWCTDLSIFDNVELTSGKNLEVYCYETKQKFKSKKETEGYIKTQINSSVINDPHKTAAGLHWCTDLSIFDNVELLYSDSQVSSYEREIVDFLKENNVDNIITSDRNIISPYELDIYLPDYNLAIEFNGNYWHSDTYKSNTYHQDKTLNCIELGIDLIQIFEFQYNSDKELYLNYILDRINGIDRKDLELDENNNHILQFCNKKYFLEKQGISEPQLLNCTREKHKIYDCGKITLKSL